MKLSILATAALLLSAPAFASAPTFAMEANAPVPGSGDAALIAEANVPTPGAQDQALYAEAESNDATFQGGADTALASLWDAMPGQGVG
ncbi:MAG: hypothetical protein INR62_02785 [Rhodospirillales bacterium]|nr:hypothetical protein [Acetobacter sp.]